MVVGSQNSSRGERAERATSIALGFDGGLPEADRSAVGAAPPKADGTLIGNSCHHHYLNSSGFATPRPVGGGGMKGGVGTFFSRTTNGRSQMMDGGLPAPS